MADPLATAQYYVFVTQVYFCCMYAVSVWDWIVCLPREYRYIWKTNWTPIKASYLFCRYWVLAAMPYLLICFVGSHSQATCEKIYKAPVALAMWNQVGAETVLLIRTYAFFNRNKYVLAGLCVALMTVIGYQLFADISQMQVLPFVTPPFTSGPCLPEAIPGSSQIIGFFIAPLLFDSVLTVMTIVRALVIRRRGTGQSSKLVQMFLAEGLFYYILISIANLINGIFYLQHDAVISATNVPLSVMMSPLLASRLILDLRERSHRLHTTSTMGTSAYSVPSSGNKTPGLPYTSGRSMGTGGALTAFGSGGGITTTIHHTSTGETVELVDYAHALGGGLKSDKESGEFSPVESDVEMGVMGMGGMGMGMGGIRIDVEKTVM